MPSPNDISFNYPLNTYAFDTTSFVDISINLISGVPSVFSCSPSFAAIGLTFDTSNGHISGPTSFSNINLPTLYTVTASADDTPSVSTTITLGINFEPIFNYNYSPYILEINATLVPPPPPPTPPTVNSIITPTYQISNLVDITYSILSGNSLPVGLLLNTTNGSIYGIPTSLSSPITFGIRANNQGILYDTSLNISIQAAPVISYPNTTYILTQGETVNIIPNEPTVYESIDSYSITGCDLPLGLTFNTQTGAITGTPTVLTTYRAYTVTANNAIGTGSTTLILDVIKIFLTTPVVADNFSSNSFLTDPSLEMRRKAEIFQYKKNSATLTKSQKLAQLARNNGPYAKRSWGTQGDAYTNPNISGLPQAGNTLVCNSNAIICAPTSSSDVPGPVMNLCYNPAVPLIGYNAPTRKKISVGFKWPQQAWRVGNNGFPIGKAGTGPL